MARMRITLVLLLALAAGGGLAYGTYSYMQNVQVKTVSLPTRPVVVAAADLELGAELRADDLRVVEWPESAMPMGAFANPDESRRARPGDAGHPERADPADEAGGQGRRLGPARRDPGRQARRVGARQRSHRRGRLRAAGHQGGRPGHGEPDARSAKT